jgi:prophage regulatory protein
MNQVSELPSGLSIQPQSIDRFLRLDQVLEIFPIGKSTWWQWVSTGKAPKGIKLGSKTTAWKSSDIRKLMDDLSSLENAP